MLPVLATYYSTVTTGKCLYITLSPVSVHQILGESDAHVTEQVRVALDQRIPHI